ncbi:MAG: efflux RND transporter periplasmic adaptor subunit [Verrucomicrobiales bacterium]|nr:efflux RND transporter periplasmic adaptor subunit [Verrucomicrobiales bacterium]
MNTKTSFLKLFPRVAGILALATTLAVAEGPVIELEAGALANLQLQFSAAEEQRVMRPVSASGTVQLNGKRVFEVTPRISGVILEDPLHLGDKVEAGDLLLSIQSRELAEMVAGYVEAEEAMIFASAAAEQERRLAAKNLSSAEQVRETDLNLKQAVAAHARALQPLKLLDFNEATIHQFLADVHGSDHTTLKITSPSPGEIIEKDVLRGAAVEQDHSLFMIADLSDLWVDFQVALRDAPFLTVGSEVLVESAVTDKKREAEILYLSPLADQQSRTVMVRALLPNKDRLWRPGTPVNITAADSGTGEATLAVPASALVDFEGSKAVFVRRGESSFEPVQVTTGISDGTHTAIQSGLKAGDVVVSQNAAQLKGHLEMTSGE